MKNSILLLALTPFLFGVSCKKAEKLTPETQTGVNTFSCKINGVVFIPKKGDFVEGLTVQFYNNVDLVIIATGTQYKPVKQVSIRLKDILTIDTYSLDFTKARYATFEYPNIFSDTYHSKNLNSGQVVITKIDRQKRIISGHFDFVLSNENDPNDRVNITDGRFDVTY